MSNLIPQLITQNSSVATRSLKTQSHRGQRTANELWQQYGHAVAQLWLLALASSICGRLHFTLVRDFLTSEVPRPKVQGSFYEKSCNQLNAV